VPRLSLGGLDDDDDGVGLGGVAVVAVLFSAAGGLVAMVSWGMGRWERGAGGVGEGPGARDGW